MSRPVRPRYGIREVAAAAGVSVGTVSNVLNNPDLVASETRERVEQAMRQVGFVRNGLAHQLRLGRSNTAAAMVLSIGNPFFTEAARGIEDRLAQADCMLILCSTDKDSGREARQLRSLEEQGVRGLIITPGHMQTEPLLALQRRGIPVVLLDCPSPTPELCSVSVDDVHGGELVATHLLSQGHRQILFLNGCREVYQCVARSRGVHRALQAEGLEPSRHLLEVSLTDVDDDDAERAVEQILGLPEWPTAIMCVNDVVALGVLRCLRKRGIKVPDDIAVVGYDDVSFAAELSTPLTTVRQPTYQLGYTAAALLLADADGATDHQRVVLQPELVVRDSA
ncbi:LacI family transcriptional regulator [Saccharothrix ecbatanensis]|uniref:LacI family transcriptional regulator n=1 Tax=Saccharothrix ecbatanensis TaxID=1105145 RepID=A0A7W9HVS4_9PSEU|nr:LacI family DNA-binding transcriptional regulator [Saccharothrix ecbatanensis]MBB5808914.1 LacI family transcriptional regulator [Saccharothrix ecbatanensis]